jgi:molybdopterin synthase catalytic subunit
MDTQRIHIELTDHAIDLGPLRALIADPDVGAHGWFEGVTRRTTGDRLTERLAYEAHRPMAMLELQKLAAQALEKFDLQKVVIVHRLGNVPVGQASVVVGCSSPHRVATFAALPWIMDGLKRDVPIWKQESYSDGTTHWVHPIDG